MNDVLWTADEMSGAYRDALAMALAGYREDGEAVAAIWSGTPNHQALVFTLSRLPALMIRAVSARSGPMLDPEEVFEGLLRDLPYDIPQEG